MYVCKSMQDIIKTTKPKSLLSFQGPRPTYDISYWGWCIYFYCVYILYKWNVQFLCEGDPWSSKRIAGPCLLGTAIILTSHCKLKNLSSQSCFCSADTIKKSEKTGWPQVILPKWQIFFLLTATASNQLSFCLSALMDRAPSWMGLSKAPAQQSKPVRRPSCRNALPLDSFPHRLSCAVRPCMVQQRLPLEQFTPHP